MGIVPFEEYASVVESINEENFQINHILDLRKGQLTDWTPDKFIGIQHVFGRISHIVVRTAVVTSQDYHVGLVRMSENIKKAQRDWDNEIRFFSTMAEAEQWLDL